MKKQLCVLLIVITLFSLAACGGCVCIEADAACAPGGNAAADKRADASPNGGAYTAAAFGERNRRTGSDRHERHHALYDDL
mgnify:CR=1 FL=1